MRKGLLDLCILSALLQGEWYGYALVKALVAIPGIGVAEGSIYPLLSRLRKRGLVTTRLEESTEGPARKYYCLTEAGREQAAAMSGYFDDLMKGVKALDAGEFTPTSSKALDGPQQGKESQS
ncbi:PadR family transcriptional regulator [Haloferula chungangensis]|uniref:PadR family transcriptional regulator n=1 Tax=Haloferula chungangensis TaxID=1048331 RepID=A0ABW2LAE1_9BACT